MKFNKVLAILMAILMLSTLPALALAEDNYGSAAVADGQTYSLEQMLNYAMEDEYMAQAEYQLILAAYGTNNAFSNIVEAEATHIEELTALFNAYGFTLPENTASQRVTLPESLEVAYQTGVDAEIANIAMYEGFLSQNDLPQAVRDVFEDLQKASESHLTAFSRNADKDGNGMRNGVDEDSQGNGNNDSQGNGNSSNSGNGNATTRNNSENCMSASGQGKNQRTDAMTGQGKNARYSDNSEDCDCDGTGDCNEEAQGDENQYGRKGA